jgi:hypothetical protein
MVFENKLNQSYGLWLVLWNFADPYPHLDDGFGRSIFKILRHINRGSQKQLRAGHAPTAGRACSNCRHSPFLVYTSMHPHKGPINPLLAMNPNFRNHPRWGPASDLDLGVMSSTSCGSSSSLNDSTNLCGRWFFWTLPICPSSAG